MDLRIRRFLEPRWRKSSEAKPTGTRQEETETERRRGGEKAKGREGPEWIQTPIVLLLFGNAAGQSELEAPELKSESQVNSNARMRVQCNSVQFQYKADAKKDGDTP